MQSLRLLSATLAFTCALLPAQSGGKSGGTGLEQAEAAFAKKAASTLMKFASFARTKKMRTKEKEAYDLIITTYDTEHKQARSKLGFRKVKGEWQAPPPKKAKEWIDKANDKARYDVVGRWQETSKKLGDQHRTRGLALLKEGTANPFVGQEHLRQAILYNPFDKPAHEALGHEEGEDGYFGTPEQLAFIKKMKAIETFALQLAKKEYELEPVTKIPEELQKTELSFHGAKSKHFTIFTRGTQENANDCALWAERALDFFEHVVGERRAKLARRRMGAWGWIGYLWTPKERELFEEENPQVKQKEHKTSNIHWRKGNKSVQVSVKNMPSAQHDDLIAFVFQYGLLGSNDQLREGAMHAATWLMKSTCITHYGAAPEGTRGEAEIRLPEGANWWIRKIRDQATGGTDTPINTVPRIPFWKFHNDARLKSWSFMTWAMARYPKKWLEFIRKVPSDKIPFPKEVDQAGADVFDKPLAEVEAEWREWASGRGVTAAATGYGPPLIPERPKDEEIEGLSRLSQVRALAIAGPIPEKIRDKALHELREAGLEALPTCELDAEASLACRNHAVFLSLHEDHHTWPEAHEEDPAKEGFTPIGMRAGLRSVIVTGSGGLDAGPMVDQWIGTVYHRFPLLEYAVRRIGFACADGPAGEAVVLDMGSLEEPRTRELDLKYPWIVWPPDRMKDIPRQFAFTEYPNPLKDVGGSLEDQQKTGYPVSLQMSRLLAQSITDASIALYIGKKRGGKYEKGDEIDCWVHTPDEPLLKRMEIRNVVFAMPKEVLKANTTYLAEVTLAPLTDKPAGPVQWTFTTGTRMQRLGRLPKVGKKKR